MGVTKERGFLIVYKHTHTHLGPWHSLIFLTPHNKILIWVSPSVFVLEKSIAFCGHFYLSISTVSKTETWKQIGIFQTSIRFYESNFAQSILFFFFRLLYVSYITTDGKTAEKWDLAHSLWDKRYFKKIP